MAQIYRSKKWGWFRLISYKHLLSRVLQSKPEPDFFFFFFCFPVSCPFTLAESYEGDGRWPQLHVWEFQQLWRGLQLLWITGIFSWALMWEENLWAHLKSLLNHPMAPSTSPTPTSAGVTTVDIPNPKSSIQLWICKSSWGGCLGVFLFGVYSIWTKGFGLHFM